MNTGANHIEVMTKLGVILGCCVSQYSEHRRGQLSNAMPLLVASSVARVVEERSLHPRLWDSWLVPSSAALTDIEIRIGIRYFFFLSCFDRATGPRSKSRALFP